MFSLNANGQETHIPDELGPNYHASTPVAPPIPKPVGAPKLEIESATISGAPDKAAEIDRVDKDVESTMDSASGKVLHYATTRCKVVAEKARKSCAGSELSVQISPMLNVLSASMGTDQNKACRVARSIAALSTGANIALATSCAKFKNSCDSSCSEDAKTRGDEAEILRNKMNAAVGPLVSSQLLALYKTALMESKASRYNSKQCKTYEGNVQQAMIQSAMSAITFAQSNQCVKLTDNITTPTTQTDPACFTYEAYENPNCPQWCLKPGRQNEEKCKVPVPSMPQCSDPVYAENPMCKPPEPFNPGGPGSGGGGGTIGGGDGNDGGGIGTGGDSRGNTIGLGNRGISDIPELPPGEAPMNPLQRGNEQGGNNASPGGGGGGVGGGFSGGGGGGGPPGSGDGQEQASNKEVFVPMTNAPGGSDAGITTEGGDGDAGGPNSGLASDDASGAPPFDLSKFLPKDLQDTRMPASDPALAANGISDANGLSNWEKVTRKMNEKRGELKP